MIKYLVDAAGPARESKAVDGQGNQAQMAESSEGHKPPEVLLHQGQTCAIENADDSECHQVGCGRASLSREEPHVEAEHRIEAEFACDDHGQGNRCLVEGVSQPAVQREDGNLDREGKQKRECHPAHGRGWEISVRKQKLKRNKVEAPGARV